MSEDKSFIGASVIRGEIDLIQEIENIGRELKDLISRINGHTSDLPDGSNLSTNSESKRWASIGETNLQQGLMAIKRAVEKPETF